MIEHRVTIALETRKATAEGIPAVLSTDAPILRGGESEILDHSPAAVDLGRAARGLPLLAHHQHDKPVGRIEQIRLDGGKLRGMIRFGASELAREIAADVENGVLTDLSVGYRIHKTEQTDDGYRITRWEPLEASIVAIPADPGAGLRRSIQGVSEMNTPNTAAREINELCKRHNVAHLAGDLIANEATFDQARAAVLEHLAARDAAGTASRTPHAGGSEADREMIVRTFIARMGGKIEGEIIRSADCAGLAVRALELAGHRVDHRASRDDIMRRALHGTSDFPQLLGDAVGRVLHSAYIESPAALKAVARQADLPDFRSKSVVRLGEAPSLEKVNEHGEFTYGTINEAANGWKLSTYGRIIGLTRQALINDDLAGFATLLHRFGQSASRREADELVAILLTPPTLDGAALFHADNSSLIANALNLAGLGAAVAALRAQQDIGGGLIMQEPAAIVVPAALEMTARQLVATFAPTAAGEVQPFRLDVVVEPRLDAASATAWYLVAGNQGALEYGYLDGQAGVQIEQRQGFEIDGLEIKARLDFGCGWVAPTGWVKSTGAGA